jgi:hypothetical protein
LEQTGLGSSHVGSQGEEHASKTMPPEQVIFLMQRVCVWSATMPGPHLAQVIMPLSGWYVSTVSHFLQPTSPLATLVPKGPAGQC